jgi:HAD superfamily hydrolase (TIGR01509 family)
MDGVLVNARELHYQTLNQALVEHGYPAITRAEQAMTYEALPTKQKLRIYSDKRGLPPELHASINRRKQQLTLERAELDLQIDHVKIAMLRQLHLDGIRLFCASNAVPESVAAMLKATGLYDWIETRLSNQDVENCKPHPEIYNKAMSLAGVTPAETLIIEDSPVGRMAAVHSGAWLCEVTGPDDVTYSRVRAQIDLVSGNAQPLPEITVLIPMAGAGSRFAQAGYTFPKPLIEVNGKPMIELVVRNLAARGPHVFVVREEHCQQYALKYMLQLLQPGCQFATVDCLTQGAACTTLLAEKYIDNDRPLLIANSDQFMDWDPGAFYHQMADSAADGAILTFRSTHPKWSYVKLDAQGFVTELAEKKPISDIATVGVYYWAKGSDYVRYARQMIRKNIRVNNEFYVAPVYNEAIADGKKIITYDVHGMWGLGTPEDLTYFLEHRE